MLKRPSQRKKKQGEEGKLNLIPILDAIFNVIFFILMSANFINSFEINSNVPIISSQQPPKDKKEPLALTVEISEKTLVVKTGIPSKTVRRFQVNQEEGDFDYQSLHELMIDLKKKHMDEKTVIFEPDDNVGYDIIIKVMDAVRTLATTDESLYSEDEQGVPVRLNYLFNDIIFGNITG